MPNIAVLMKRCGCATHAGPNPLPVTEFPQDRSRLDGLSHRCRGCWSVYARQRRNADRAKAAERWRRWKKANPELRRAQKRRANERVRNIVLDHYGRICACCGSTNRLQVDHVNGNGKQHRTEVGHGIAVYYSIINSGFPDGFQTLCAPCNRSKASGRHCHIDHCAASATSVLPSRYTAPPGLASCTVPRLARSCDR